MFGLALKRLVVLRLRLKPQPLGVKDTVTISGVQHIVCAVRWRLVSLLLAARRKTGREGTRRTPQPAGAGGVSSAYQPGKEEPP
jgi:hypothetical protein